MSRVVAIIQARMGSTRLPGKLLLDLGGTTALGLLTYRLRQARRLDAIWVAVGDADNNAPLIRYIDGLALPYTRGSEDDVLGRFCDAARASNAETIVRITSDCPFADPVLVDGLVENYLAARVDYAANNIEPRYPKGLDIEVFSREALFRTELEATHPYLRAHVTPYIHGRLKHLLPHGSFTILASRGPADFSSLRFTLDTPDDLAFFRAILPKLPPDFSWLDVVARLCAEPSLLSINAGHSAYEGSERDLVHFGVTK